MVVTSNGTPGGINMFIDGVQTIANPDTGCYNPQGSNNLGDFFLGKEFTGILDDVTLFDRVLNPNEISQLFELELCCL